MKFEQGIEAWGFGTALFFGEIFPLMNANGLSAYHSSSVNRATMMLALAGMIVFAALYLALLHLPRTQAGRRARVAMAVLLPLLALLADRYPLKYLALRVYDRLSHAKLQALVTQISLDQALAWFALWAILLLVLFRWSPRWYRIVTGTARISLIAVGLLGCVATVDMFRAMYSHRNDHVLLPMHERTAAEELAHPRIVWIIFDELSYNQAFDHRFPGLKMPNFDALAAQSDVYTDAQPVAYFTDLAVPSLLIGEQADAVRYTFSKGVRFRFDGETTMRGFDAAKSLPALAQRDGWNVGIVGWWNPYCMLMSGYLQSCRWAWREDWAYPKMRAKYTVAQNVEHWVHALYASQPKPQLLYIRDEENHDFYSWAQDLLNNQDMDFIFLHVTMPHPPAISDRHIGLDVLKQGSYVDGLALADRTLGGLMHTIEASPRWPNTTVVVDGDHSWRTLTYRSEADWLPEDEQASDGGKFDIRPTVLVHHPGQAAERKIDAPTPLLAVHGIIQSVIQDSVAPNAGHGPAF